MYSTKQSICVGSVSVYLCGYVPCLCKPPGSVDQLDQWDYGKIHCIESVRYVMQCKIKIVQATKYLPFFLSKKQLSRIGRKIPSIECYNKCIASANMSWFGIILHILFVNLMFVLQFSRSSGRRKNIVWLLHYFDLLKVVVSIDFMWVLSFRWKI